MSRLIWLASVSGIVAFALLTAFRSEVAAAFAAGPVRSSTNRPRPARRRRAPRPRLETLFGRTCSARPRVLIFGTASSFATGAQDLFGYSRATSATWPTSLHRTDRRVRMYRGSFGSTAAPGTYTVSAAGAVGILVTTR